MASLQSNRKKEHVALSERYYNKNFPSPFDDLRFVPHALPQTKVAAVNLHTQFAGIKLDVPFYINAMTGGSEWTGQLNEKLAIVARETGLAMATGSASIALKEAEAIDSFKVVRRVNPNGIVFVNLGAGHSVENAQKAIDLLQADALQIHLNAPQEIVMPEGDRDFSHWADNIQAINHKIALPLIVKEVGFGMSRETVALLKTLGVKNIDISGFGGTNFSQIENFRRTDFSYADLENWGLSTPASLLETQKFVGDLNIIASGGIRRPLDVAKSLALGAQATAFSSFILHSVITDGVDKTIAMVEGFKQELAGIFALLGAHSVSDLHQADIVVTGETKDWAEARKIDYQALANRSAK